MISTAAVNTLAEYVTREDCISVLSALEKGPGIWEQRCKVKPEHRQTVRSVVVTCNGEIVTVGLIPAAKRQSKPQGFHPA